MAGRRRHPDTTRSLIVSVGWILALIASYCLMAEWHSAPHLLAATAAWIA